MGTHNIVLRQNNRSETPPTTDDANKFNIITFPRFHKVQNMLK